MRHSQFAPRQSIAALLVALALIAGCPATTPTINLESQPTAEGLYEVTGIDADEAVVRRDSDMSQYSKIVLENIDIAFRPGGESGWSHGASRSGGPYEVSGDTAAEYRAIAEREIMEEFGESKQLTLVEQPGADVLSVTVKLLDVVSYIPPERIGRSSASLRELGEATLVMELRDSTGALIARSSDRHTVDILGNELRFDTGITNTAAIEEFFRLFARQMRRQLEAIGTLGE